MAESVRVGKVSYLGLRECFRETLRRADKVHPIASVQMEYCLLVFGHCIMNFLEATKDLGITVVAK
jgi:aryl-alcohol dehydrogenase-like predicted oxidoreductase